jgi:hypothetical protein
MNKVLLITAISVFGGSLFAQESPTIPKAARVRITQGPEVELAKQHLTIIRWTTNNPGGSPVHYGIVHYGTDPNDLSQTAKSPFRFNPDDSSTVFSGRRTITRLTRWRPMARVIGSSAQRTTSPRPSRGSEGKTLTLEIHKVALAQGKNLYPTLCTV